MNLTLQTRRAMITLGLAAAAIVCVAARSTVVGEDAAIGNGRLQLMSGESAPVEATRVVITHVRSGELISFLKQHAVRKSACTRCE